MGVVGVFVLVLVVKVELECEFVWCEMRNINWLCMESVLDYSFYVSEFLKYVNSKVEEILLFVVK